MVWKRVFLLIAAVVLFPTSAYASEYTVTASVPAPLPTTLPQITVNDVLATPQLPNTFVTGTCTVVVPAVVVLLIRNGQVIGSGSCSESGTFRILVGLVLGQNIIYPRYITITGEMSGDGSPVTFVYTPLQPVNRPVANNNQQIPTVDVPAASLELGFDYNFVTYTDTQSTKLQANVRGGRLPYVMTINWGDGTQVTKKLDKEGPIELEHNYRNILPPSSMTITVVDAAGSKVVQSRALVNFRNGVYVPPAAQPVAKERSWLLTWLIVMVCFSMLLFIRHLRHASTRSFRTFHKKSKRSTKKK